MRKFFSLLTLIALLLVTVPSQAQIIVVEDDFRIVAVDFDDNRFAVARPEADPDVRQNWVYLENDIRLSYREYMGNGAFRDNVVTNKREILNILASNEGDLIKVHGGRDFDGSIDASKIWM